MSSPKAARRGGFLSQQQRVEEALDLTRVALGAARQDGADLVAEHQRVVRLGCLVTEGCFDGIGVERRAFPRALQTFARHRNQLAEALVVLAKFRASQQQRDVNAGLRLTERRDPERNLNQLLQVVAGVVARARGLGQVGKVLAHRVLDHSFVGSHDKCRARCEHQEAYCLQCLDGDVGQAAVEIVD
jgi:hypothetical protein